MRSQIQDYRDRHGNRIGGRINVAKTFIEAYKKISSVLDTRSIKGSDVASINNLLNDYRAASYCYNLDTINQDATLDSMIKDFQVVSRHIQFETIRNIGEIDTQ